MEHTSITFAIIATDFASLWKSAQHTATSLGVWGPDIAGFELVCESIQPEEIVRTLSGVSIVSTWRAEFTIENVPADFTTVSINLI
jgi:hypothetical protein